MDSGLIDVTVRSSLRRDGTEQSSTVTAGRRSENGYISPRPPTESLQNPYDVIQPPQAHSYIELH